MCDRFLEPVRAALLPRPAVRARRGAVHTGRPRLHAIGAGRGRHSSWIDLVCNDSDGYETYYRAAVQLIKEIGGRPHLGKYCEGFAPDDLERVLGDGYREFLRIVAEHDPDGKFANAFTRRCSASVGARPM